MNTTPHAELEQQIRQHYAELPRNQRLVADFFITNIEKIAFLTVHSIARQTGSSVASVVRFCQSIGYSGFGEIREAVSTHLQDKLLNVQERFPLIHQPHLNGTFNSVANQDIQNINETLATIREETFTGAVDLIVRAQRIYTAGLGISNLLAQILAYQLMQVGIDAHTLRHDCVTFPEQALLFKKRDLVIVFSFPPYSRETIELAQMVNEKHLHLIAITNHPSAPATFCADISLIVKSVNLLYTNSFAAISVLINALTTECARRDTRNAQQMLEDLNRIAHEQKLVLNI